MISEADRAARHPGAAVPTLAQWTLFGFLAGVVVIAMTRPAALHPWIHHAPPPLETLAAAVLYVGLALVLPGRIPVGLLHLALAGALTGLYCTARVGPLGDFATWRHVATTGDVHGSSILANVLYRAVRDGFGEPALSWLPPVVGFLTALTYFTVVDRLVVRAGGDGVGAADGARHRTRRFVALYYLASGVQLLYFRHYFEIAQLACPFVLLFLYGLVRYTTTAARGGLVVAAVGLALAALTHLGSLAVAPAVPIAIVWRRVRDGGWSAVPADAAAVLGSVALVGGATWALLEGYGLTVIAGHASTATAVRWVDVWPDKVVEAANIALLASPLAFAAPLWLAQLWREAQPAAADRFALVLVAGGGVGFFSLYGFHLGFPNDYDLMVAPTLGLNIVLLQIVLAGRGRMFAVWRAGLLVIGGAATWAVMSSQLAPEPTTGGYVFDVVRTARAPQLSLRQTQDGGLEATVTRVPPAYDEGWLYVSPDTTRPVGGGAFFGLTHHPFVQLAFLQRARIGSFMHFPRHDEDAFPRTPVVIPAAFIDALRGETMDAVVVFARDRAQIVAVSNVVRITLSPAPRSKSARE